MARHKIPPVAPTTAVSDAMRRASTQIAPPTAETLFGPQFDSARSKKSSSKGRTPSLRSSQTRATSEPTAKPKATPLGNGSTAPEVSQSSSRASSSDAGDVAVEDAHTISDAKRQKLNDAPRRSTRLKPAIEASTAVHPVAPAKKALRKVADPVEATPNNEDTSSLTSTRESRGSEDPSSAPTSVSGAAVASEPQSEYPPLPTGEDGGQHRSPLASAPPQPFPTSFPPALPMFPIIPGPNAFAGMPPAMGQPHMPFYQALKAQ
ncbi:uncharacterized protein AB675_4604 [Cyphellophora attinorum]|uniref:Uncharacterized protein n=1 Tax=Cyphellophora attinorum TaxID=1664694 RepID=A0A0N1H812_9EURO|nr:uncharacterized protein AB675_4604 [Phialophora attinorum]KPI39047.1 hypothetical protein AB675_4604 [Phialophora attinorum]